MTPYDRQQIWDKFRQLDKEKINRCSFESLMNRVNYLETTNADFKQRIDRLEQEVQDILLGHDRLLNDLASTAKRR